MSTRKSESVVANIGPHILGNRFWSKVEKTDSCWLWRGTVTENGYGHYWIEGKYKRPHILVYGDPGDLFVHHTCEVKLCCNPEHLIALSHQDHMRLHAAAKTHCPKGHAYSGEIKRRGSVERFCRTCRVEATREWRAR